MNFNIASRLDRLIRVLSSEVRSTIKFIFVASLLVSTNLAFAEAPILYSNTNYQSPVRGEPDDLLLIPGYGFSANDTVVYKAITNTTADLNSLRPETIEDADGVITVVSTADTPYSLTVKLPDLTEMISGQSYAFWVKNSANEWSNGILINDARPLWFSPSYVYETNDPANLGRYLKIVGRNLQPEPATGSTQVRLIGPDSSTNVLDTFLASNNDNPLGLDATAIDRYVAKIDLPSSIPVGNYLVEVSRDNISWVRLEQQLEVKADPSVLTEYPVANYGCVADDSSDDTACVITAINAAKVNGGVVVFGTGTWNLIDGDTPGTFFRDGIVVPIGVSLRGAGSDQTTIVRDAAWQSSNTNQSRACFTLQGSNKVSDITFKDEKVYLPNDKFSWMLQLGRAYNSIYWKVNEPKITKDVIITNNVFDKPLVAIEDGGLPIENIFVTYNEFGAFKYNFNPDGNRYNNMFKFHLDDAVITHNIFKPGSYISEQDQQGAIASSLGASRRVDFSNNFSDGSVAATEYLYEPYDDDNDPNTPDIYLEKITGWRAAHFWAMNNNSEMMLVSENKATCPGDKTGDGEAFAYDNNGNTFAFSEAKAVLASSSNSIKVSGPLKSYQNSRSLNVINPAVGIPYPDTPYLDHYYDEHWISIPEGKGLGQVRRISSYTIDTDSVTFTVEPAWDVVPDEGSRITVARQFWQVHTVDNYIDQREDYQGIAQCTKDNHIIKALGDNKIDTRVYNPEGGAITLWAHVADSSVENNQMYETDGIIVAQRYEGVSTHFQSFVEIRGNTIDGEYDWDSDCSWSGIWSGYSASNTTGLIPPVAGYGVSISHNVITHADALRGGAIAITGASYRGPSPEKWKLVNNTLIHHNDISNITRDAAPEYQDYSTPENTDLIYKCDSIVDLYPAAGIKITRNSRPSPLVWRSVLYDNTCDNVQEDVVDNGTSTIRVCPEGQSNSCECNGVLDIDVELNAEAFSHSGPEGNTRYEITITNLDDINQASGITFSVEPDANSIIDSSSSSNAYAPSDLSVICVPEVGTCTISTLDKDSSSIINVYATALGEAAASFSVTHTGYDSDVSNNGVTVFTNN